MSRQFARLTSIRFIISFLISLAFSFSVTTSARSETVIPRQDDTQQRRSTDLTKQESRSAVIKADKNNGLVIQDGNAKLILGSGKRDEIRDFDQRLMMSRRTDNPKSGGICVKFGMDF